MKLLVIAVAALLGLTLAGCSEGTNGAWSKADPTFSLSGKTLTVVFHVAPASANLVIADAGYRVDAGAWQPLTFVQVDHSSGDWTFQTTLPDGIVDPADPAMQYRVVTTMYFDLMKTAETWQWQNGRVSLI